MMETETVLAELAKINDYLASIEARLNDMQTDLIILRKDALRTRPDRYKSWPTDDELDVEEANELIQARENAPSSWKAINSAEKRAAYILDDNMKGNK